MARHVKTTEQLGLEVGFTGFYGQYGAAVGRLGAAVDLIAGELDTLWETPGLEFEDLRRTLMNIEDIVKKLVVED